MNTVELTVIIRVFLTAGKKGEKPNETDSANLQSNTDTYINPKLFSKNLNRSKHGSEACQRGGFPP